MTKSVPQSVFKKIYRAAKKRLNEWHATFLPWSARPDRDTNWYEAQADDIFLSDGSLDRLHEQYPATDSEALKPNSKDKRISSDWIEDVYDEWQPLNLKGAPAVPSLIIFKPPVKGRLYVIGADPAEGNPTSDDSAGQLLDAATGEQIAKFSGKHEMKVFAAYLHKLSVFYGYAGILVERNNHGHAVIAALDVLRARVLAGDDNKAGWISTVSGKTTMYDELADGIREGNIAIHDETTYTQVASIEGNTLRAPEGEMDDEADALALANLARRMRLARKDRSERMKRARRRRRRGENDE